MAIIMLAENDRNRFVMVHSFVVGQQNVGITFAFVQYQAGRPLAE
jgi:hypothetical protein